MTTTKEEYEALKGKLVEVLWDDAAYWAEEKAYSQIDSLEDEEPVLTWGLVVRVSDKSLFVASEHQPANGTYRTTTRIPFAYITGIRELKAAEEPPEDSAFFRYLREQRQSDPLTFTNQPVVHLPGCEFGTACLTHRRAA